MSEGFWPTPNCMDAIAPRDNKKLREWNNSRDGRKNREVLSNLREAVMDEQYQGMFPTPSSQEPGWKHIEVVDKDGNPPTHPNQRFYDKKTGRLVQKGLPQVARMWPTPRATDHFPGQKTNVSKTETGYRVTRKTGTVFGAKLGDAVNYEEKNQGFWPTPNSHEEVAERYTIETSHKHFKEGRQIHLSQSVRDDRIQNKKPNQPTPTHQPQQMSIFSQEDFHAKVLVSPGSNEARKMTATSGQRCMRLSKLQGPVGSLERMLLGSLNWHSTRCYLTWKPKATPQGSLYYQLAVKMPRTGGIGFGLWPTMESKPSGGSPEAYLKAKTRNKNLGGGGLEVAVKMWPTPTVPGKHQVGVIGERGGSGNPLRTPENMSVKTGALNADWVSLLQGYPKDWTTLGDQDGKTAPPVSSQGKKTG